MRKPLVLSLAAVITAAVGALVPASAHAADTGVTFDLGSGSLSITAPATATLTAGALQVGGTTVSGALGTTTVTDTRGALAHTDTVNMATTAFTSGGYTIPAANVTGYSGVVTPAGVATVVPSLTGQTIGATGGATILQLTGVVGSVTATYSPTVSVSVPGDALSGTYSGTVTQTVS